MPTNDLDFRLLFEQSPDVLLVLRADAPRFTMVGATNARHLATHTTPEQIEGRGLFEVFPDNPDDATASGTSNLRLSLERVLATRAADTMAVQKYDIRGPNGEFETKYWSPKNVPVLSPSGEVLYILHRVEDVTELVRASEVGQELRDKTRAMEREVVARSRELSAANAELRRANDRLTEALAAAESARAEAQRANRAKTAFLSAMSHEIRTPMNAVIGFSNLLVDTELTGEQIGFVESIRSSGAHLIGVIDDILDYSKLESGHFTLDRAAFDLRRMVEAALDFVALRASEKGVELAYAVDDEVPASCVADEARVRQVLANYLANAVKFTERGEVVVHVGAKALGDGRYEFHFSVRDTGVGISPDGMRRLFQEFSQLDPSITRRFGGTGLGLAISKSLVDLHGGTVWAESEQGRGSVFHFTIPAEAGAMKSSPPSAGRGARLRGKRVLLVDDNDTNLDILRTQAESWGMFVRATREPEKALGWIRRGDPFDFIILDHYMPAMDGLELARAIHVVPEVASTPLILLTSLGGTAEISRSAKGLFAAVLTKPVRQSFLFDLLVDILDVGPAAPASAAASSGPQAARGETSILLVEDNVVNQKLAMALLGSLGLSADLACDGAEAVRAVHSKAYDVVLMDVQMPVMDGIEATRAIRQEGSAVHQPRIVAMTAGAMEEDRDACVAAGMDDFVPKPIDRARLAMLLHVAPRGEAPARPEPSPRPDREIQRATLDELGARVGTPSLVSIIDLFLRDTSDVLGVMRKALTRDDAPRLARAAHTLKATAATVGAERLSNIAGELATVASRGTLAPASDLVASLEHRWPRARAELLVERDNRASSEG